MQRVMTTHFIFLKNASIDFFVKERYSLFLFKIFKVLRFGLDIWIAAICI